MGTYRQYCPIARASEILAERWNPLIVRNLMFGADTFSAIARGVPTMSRSMLLKRLDELERAGVIESSCKSPGPRSRLPADRRGRRPCRRPRRARGVGRALGGGHPRPFRSRFRVVGVVPGAARPISVTRWPSGRRLHFSRRACGQSALLALGRARRGRGLLHRPGRRSRPEGLSAVPGVRRLAPWRSIVARRAPIR